MPKLFTLTERLALCASFVDNGAKFIDIGTDHGYLPIWLLKSGIINENGEKSVAVLSVLKIW